MRTKKVLYVLLLAVIMIIIGYLIFRLTVLPKKEKSTIKEPQQINEQTLSGDEEKIGTLTYPGQKLEVKSSGNTNTASFETTDSPEGAVNIYYQDLVSRYPDYDVSNKEIKRQDAVDNKAYVLRVAGKTGQITITVWGKKDGKTQIEVNKDADFK